MSSVLSESSPSSLPVFVLEPPYTCAPQPLSWYAGAGSRHPDGSILLMRCNEVPDSEGWIDSIRSLRRSMPQVATLLWVPRPECPAASAQFAVRVSRTGARATIFGETVDDDHLRPLLTQPVDLGGDVVEWLQMRGLRLAPTITPFLAQAFHNTNPPRSLDDLFQRISSQGSSMRSRFRKRNLPPPTRWFQLARALRAALTLQASPGTSVYQVAVQEGYADHSAMSQQLRRTFGITAGEVRRLLGWEWLMERWYTTAIEDRSTPVTGATIHAHHPHRLP